MPPTTGEPGESPPGESLAGGDTQNATAHAVPIAEPGWHENACMTARSVRRSPGGAWAPPSPSPSLFPSPPPPPTRASLNTSTAVSGGVDASLFANGPRTTPPPFARGLGR